MKSLQTLSLSRVVAKLSPLELPWRELKSGCQAECGAAAAMGSGALATFRAAAMRWSRDAVALALKSILGLVCDPVGGLVEAPCIKRNGTLTALGAVSADMALAGIKSVIPADEVIDAMSRVGKAIPPSLRETSLGDWR